MAEVTFRHAVNTSTESVKEAPASGTDPVSISTAKVEVPYLDYEREHNHPHSVDYFSLGDSWKDPVGGFSKEIGIIEEYFENQISRGELPNSVSAVKDRMKEILKITNMSKEERNLLKIETIAAYIKFLSEKQDIERSVKRYGSAK